MVIVAHVVDKCRHSSAVVDMDPLENCLKEVKKLAELYRDRGAFSRMARIRSDEWRIQVKK